MKQKTFFTYSTLVECLQVQCPQSLSISRVLRYRFKSLQVLCPMQAETRARADAIVLLNRKIGTKQASKWITYLHCRQVVFSYPWMYPTCQTNTPVAIITACSAKYYCLIPSAGALLGVSFVYVWDTAPYTIRKLLNFSSCCRDDGRSFSLHCNILHKQLDTWLITDLL